MRTTINKAVSAGLLVAGALLTSGALHDGNVSWAELLAALGAAVPAGAIVWRVPYFKRGAGPSDVSRETSAGAGR